MLRESAAAGRSDGAFVNGQPDQRVDRAGGSHGVVPLNFKAVERKERNVADREG